METLAAPAAQNIDFSLIALFWRASPVVKLVLVLLSLASIWSWATIIAKALTFAGARREAKRFDAAFWSGQPLDDLYDRIGSRPAGGAERVFAAGMAEWRRSHREDGGLIAGAQTRIDRAMQVATAREEERLTRGLGLLATIGSTAPFVGLFGTVWGIKTAFEGIAISQNTNLAVVAPGIAEALVATALGLFAAIPAVIAYNWLVGAADRLAGGYDAFGDEFATLLSRQLDAG